MYCIDEKIRYQFIFQCVCTYVRKISQRYGHNYRKVCRIANARPQAYLSHPKALAVENFQTLLLCEFSDEGKTRRRKIAPQRIGKRKPYT